MASVSRARLANHTPNTTSRLIRHDDDDPEWASHLVPAEPRSAPRRPTRDACASSSAVVQPLLDGSCLHHGFVKTPHHFLFTQGPIHGHAIRQARRVLVDVLCTHVAPHRQDDVACLQYLTREH